MLSAAVPTTAPINTVLTLVSLLETAAERKREHVSSEQEMKHSLNAQHMDALVSFVPSTAVHAGLSQLLKHTAKLVSTVLKHAGLKALLLTCHCLHFLQHKPTRAAECSLVKCGTHAVFGMAHSFTFTGGSAFLKSWRECLHKTQL